jgi:hypothetical protein
MEKKVPKKAAVKETEAAVKETGAVKETEAAVTETGAVTETDDEETEETKDSEWHWPGTTHPEKKAEYSQVSTVIENDGDAMEVPASVQTINLAGCAKVNAAFDKAQDKNHASHLDRVACDRAFAEHDKFLANLKKRYFNIPPCTRLNLENMGLVENSTNREVNPVPRGTCFPSADNVGRGQITIITNKQPGCLSDKPHSLKGTMILSKVRKSTDPVTTREEMNRVHLAGGKKTAMDCGAEHVGMVLDVCIAYKNGSGQTGPFSEVYSFVLS